jgi:LacI family transcriptional regulator
VSGSTDPAAPRPRSPTLKDVAAAAGVHSATVSRSLDPAKMSLVRPDTRARVQSAARELGYRPHAPAQSLRRGQTATVGLVVADISNPYTAVVVRGITTTLAQHGFMALIAESNDDHDRMRRALDNLRSRRVDGLIVTAARFGDREIVRRLAEDGLPVVLAVRTLDDRAMPAVSHDDEAGGALAGGHLAALGHAIVAQLPGPDDVSSFRQRRLGFSRAVAAARLQEVDVREMAVHPTQEEGLRLMKRVLARAGDDVTAVFAHNDVMAIGAIDAIRAAGLRCPHDVSVIGYNDAPLSDHLDPPLSTIRFPSEKIGRYAAEIAVSQIRERHAPAVFVSFPPELVQRRSTAAPPPA